jgi:hypothetical protein
LKNHRQFESLVVFGEGGAMKIQLLLDCCAMFEIAEHAHDLAHAIGAEIKTNDHISW